eukprot:5178903-Pleurochrysis_carterae.AAC.1
MQVRGGRTITTRTPEALYEALERYSRDLTAEARAGKLDPVIGRDDEVSDPRAFPAKNARGARIDRGVGTRGALIERTHDALLGITRCAYRQAVLRA